MSHYMSEFILVSIQHVDSCQDMQLPYQINNGSFMASMYFVIKDPPPTASSSVKSKVWSISIS